MLRKTLVDHMHYSSHTTAEENSIIRLFITNERLEMYFSIFCVFSSGTIFSIGKFQLSVHCSNI